MYTSSIAFLSIAVLVFIAIWFASSLSVVWKRNKRDFPLIAFPLFLFFMVYILSGIVHLMNLTGRGRGPFDLLANNDPSLIIATLLLSTLAFFAFGAGIFFFSKKSIMTAKLPGDHYSINNRMAFVISVGFLLIGMSAYSRIIQYTSRVKTSRLVSVDGDYGRYVYLTQWLVFSVVIFGLILLSKNPRIRLVFLILAVEIFLLWYLLRWSGGRIELLIVGFPLVYLSLRNFNFRRSQKFYLGISGIVSLYFYNYFKITKRLQGSSETNFSLVSTLDWELGRFSTVGATISLQRDSGYQYGGTFLNTLGKIIGGFLDVIGYQSFNFGNQFSSIQNYTGEFLAPNKGVVYLVPGFLSEVYLNFGYIGVPVAYFLFGLFVGYLVQKIQSSHEIFAQYYWTYILFSFSFNVTMNSSIGLVSQLLVFIVPLHVIMIFCRRTRTYDKNTRFKRNYVE
jgi:hypothetical protein